MAVETKVTFCRICEAHCGMVATIDDGVVTKLRPDRDHPLSQGEACPKGIAMTDVQNDPDRVTHPLRRDRSDRRVRAGQLGGGDRRHRRAAARHDRGARPRVGRLVLRQPRRVQLLARAVGEGLHGGPRLAALLHGLLAGRRQPVRRERAALRVAGARPDPRPAPHELPADGRRQPVRLARQRADRAEDQGPAARHRRARRPRRRRRSAPHRDRPPLRARRRAARTRTRGCCSRCSASSSRSA